MKRLTKTYSDGTHGASDSLPCGENSYDYKNLLIEKLGKYEDLEEQDRLVILSSIFVRIWLIGKKETMIRAHIRMVKMDVKNAC